MKKILLFCMILAFIVLIASGCEKRGICSECGQEAVLHKYKMHSANDQVVYMCDDCIRIAKFIGY